MDNTIYSTALSVVTSSTIKEQEEQHHNLELLVMQALEKKEDLSLLDAIDAAAAEQKMSVVKQIEHLVNEQVNTFFYSHNNIEYRSDLFIVPFIIVSDGNPLTLPALKTVEAVWRNHLLEQDIIEKAEEFNLAPMLLGQKTSQKMEMSRWYELHHATSLNLDKRDARPMYVNNFSIQVQPHETILSFFVATINRDNTKRDLTLPILLDHGQDMTHRLDLATRGATDDLNQGNTNAIWAFLPPSSIAQGLPAAYQFYQDDVAQTFINYYCEQEHVYLALLTLDYPETFAVLAWNEQTNTVLDVLVIEPFNVNLKQNSAFIMNLIEANNAQKVYFGEEPITLETLKNIADFDFNSYKDKNGISVLEAEGQLIEK